MPKARKDQVVALKIFDISKKTSLTELFKALPNLKLLLVVRNPIDRIVSHILHEYYNRGGIFYGHYMPDINDIILDKAEDPDVPKRFEGELIIQHYIRSKIFIYL